MAQGGDFTNHNGTGGKVIWFISFLQLKKISQSTVALSRTKTSKFVTPSLANFQWPMLVPTLMALREWVFLFLKLQSSSKLNVAKLNAAELN